MGNAKSKSYSKVRALTERDKLAWPDPAGLNPEELDMVITYKKALENYCSLYVTILSMKLDCDMSAQTQSIINLTRNYMKLWIDYLNAHGHNLVAVESKGSIADAGLQRVFNSWRNEVNDFAHVGKIRVTDIIMFHNSAVIALSDILAS